MNLEQKINEIIEIIEEYNLASDEDGSDGHRFKLIQDWTFNRTNYHIGPQEARIIMLIEKATLAECLISSSNFVREYKLWKNK